MIINAYVWTHILALCYENGKLGGDKSLETDTVSMVVYKFSLSSRSADDESQFVGSRDIACVGICPADGEQSLCKSKEQIYNNTQRPWVTLCIFYQ